MKKKSCFALVVAVMMLLNLVYVGAKVEAAGELPPIYPTYDVDFDASGKYDMDYMQVGYYPDPLMGVQIGAMQFALPAEQIVKAELRFTIANPTGNPFVAVYGSNDDDWDESGPSEPVAHTAELGRAENLINRTQYVIDVTSFVQLQTDGKVSFILQGEVAGGVNYVQVYSKEYGTAGYRPTLTLTTAVDATAPVYQNGTPNVTATTSSQTTLNVQLDEVGKAYYSLVADGSTAPTPAQVKAGQNGSGGAAIRSGTINVTAANTAFTAAITGLQGKTSYDLYVVAEDNVAVPNLQSAAVKVDFTTLNNAPSDMSISASSVSQKAGVNGNVGQLTTTDADAGDTHTYTFVTGAGDADNGSFNLSGNQLRVNDAAALAVGTYSVRIQTSDGEAVFAKSFTITVTDGTAPVYQNGTPNVTGTTSSQTTLNVQLNELGKAYYALVVDGSAAPTPAQVKAGQNGDGGVALRSGTINVTAANAPFTADITGLKGKTAYDLYVVAEDNVAMPNLQSPATKVDFTTLNNAPSDISLSASSVSQSAGVNGSVGQLSTTDADAGDAHTYTFVTGAGDADNGSFNLSGNLLRVNDAAALAAGTYSVRIQTSDGEAVFAKSFTITVTDGTAPVYQNGTPNVTGTTSSQTTLNVELDEVGKAYYALVADGSAAPTPAQVKAGQNGSGGAAIRSGTITVTAANAPFTADITGLQGKTSYDLYVVAEDNVAMPNVQSPATKVDFTTLNNAPSDIGLSASSVNQSEGVNASVGQLTTTDADAGDTHTYTFVTGAGDADNGSFNLSGNQLRVNDAAALAAGTYSVRIQTSDGVDVLSKAFTITVVDNIAPVYQNGTPNVTDITANQTTLNAQLNEIGKVYYVLVADGSAAPTPAQVKAGQNGSSGAALRSGTVNVTAANSAFTAAITGLQGKTSYDLYVVAEDNVAVPNLQSAAVKVDFATLNNAPSDISLSASSVNQSAGMNGTVGQFTTTDADAGDTHTYTFVTGAGDTDNTLFNISGAYLRANNASALAPGSYSVRVQTSDGTDTYAEIFSITVVDDAAPVYLNSTPTVTGISAGQATVTVELNETGTAYYVLTAAGAATPTAAQVKAGQDSTGSAALKSGTIAVSAANTAETASLTGLQNVTAYQLFVVAEDDESVPNVQAASTQVNFSTLNNAPTGISLDKTTVNMSAGVNGVVGQLSTADMDAGDTHTYTLTAGAGDTNNALFNLAGNQLRANDAAAMTSGSYSVRIQTDDGTETYSESFIITVEDDVIPVYLNGTPAVSGIAADKVTLTVQLDEAGTVYYVVVADGAAAPSVAQIKAGQDAGSTAAFKFGTLAVLAANTAATADITGLAGKTAYSLYVVAEDDEPAPNVQASAVNLDFTTLNHLPTDIQLSASSINQNAGTNGLVGQLSTVDGDSGDTHSYTLVAGAGDTDNALFNIDGSQLKANNASVMAAGTYSIRVQTDDGMDQFAKSFVITVVRASSPSEPSSPSNPTTPIPTPTPKPPEGNSDVVKGLLNGKELRELAAKKEIIEIKSSAATYHLPAAAVKLDDIAKQFGVSEENLQDIKFQIQIRELSGDEERKISAYASDEQLTLASPPVEYVVTAIYDGKEIEVTTFNSYVKRMIVISGDIDPSKSVTGVVVQQDGSFAHVPTRVMTIDGIDYAVIHSLTNSTYAVIQNEETFEDVRGHWSEQIVNDMAARLILNGKSDTQFAPQASITRAEFTAIIVNALGLKGQYEASLFSDVASNAWYADAVAAANAYNIIGGYSDRSFKPNATISRQEAMVILARAMAVTQLNTDISESQITDQLKSFQDREQIAAWAEQAAALCAQYGIIEGSSGNANPQAHITRAEAAAVIKRLLEKSELI